jgi:hypothetical protein
MKKGECVGVFDVGINSSKKKHTKEGKKRDERVLSFC